MAAKPKAQKLKVFQAQFGFHDSVVAATSQAAALRAWGTHQNLFADGQARIATDAAAVAAALAHPDTPLRRVVGSSAGFELEPTSLPTVPDMPMIKAPSKSSAKPKVQPPRPPADRSRLEAAEATLRKLDEGRKAEEAKLARRQAELDSRIVDAQGAYVQNRKAATAAVVDARRAYRDEGGAD